MAEQAKLSVCVVCGKATLRDGTREMARSFGGRRFVALLPAQECTHCGESYVSGHAGEAFDNTVTRALAESGDASPEALRWLRKAANLRAADLAALLDVRAETISRWETGTVSPPRAVVYALGTLAIGKAYGQQGPIVRLRALGEPRPVEEVRLDITV